MKPSDRGAIIGANGEGKSTLAKYLIDAFRRDVPDARILILDTKPRWRATKMVDGTDARKLYRKMAKGDTIPGAVSMSRLSDWPFAWSRDTNPSQTVIVQQLQGEHSANVVFQTRVLQRFFKTLDAARPSLVYIDEGMDFFTTSGTARGSDIVQRCYRAGRERGLATLAGFQRPKGINLQCLTEMNACYLFRINFEDDVKRLWDMGWPHNVGPPTYEQPHAFRVWRNGAPGAPLYRLPKGGAESGRRKAS